MKRGRKVGQTGDNPANFGVFMLKNLDRDFWRAVKIMALKRNTTIKEMVVDFLTKECKKDGLL